MQYEEIHMSKNWNALPTFMYVVVAVEDCVIVTYISCIVEAHKRAIAGDQIGIGGKNTVGRNTVGLGKRG